MERHPSVALDELHRLPRFRGKSTCSRNGENWILIVDQRWKDGRFADDK